jgi:hypothetical protein
VFSVAGRVGRTPKVTTRSAAAVATIPQRLAKARGPIGNYMISDKRG